MLCPTCKIDLTITDRQGVEIDVCPTCRGVWLDRGELDKILERSGTATHESAPRSASAAARARRWPDHGHDDDGHDDDDRRRSGQTDSPRRKKSWLGDLFDFD